jgi:FAD/FMN-containing dehydrogenase
MAGNNSCGSRSIRYGNMVHNVLAIDAVMANGAQYRFGPAAELAQASSSFKNIADGILAIVNREAAEIESRWPKVLRRVQGYNLDMAGANLAHLLVGSEGTLAWSRRLHLKLSPLPRHKTLGVCHFPSFHKAMDSAQHIVKLGPAAVNWSIAPCWAWRATMPRFAPPSTSFSSANPMRCCWLNLPVMMRPCNLRSSGNWSN